MRTKKPSLFFVLSLIVVLAGAVVESITLMAAGITSCAISYALEDYFSPRLDSIEPMTINAIFFGAWLGLGHLLGYHLIDTEHQGKFHTFTAMNFLSEAQYLATIATIVPLLSYPRFKKLFSGQRHVIPRLPKVDFKVSDKATIGYCLILLTLGWLSTLGYGAFSQLGTLDVFTSRGSEIAIFLLTWHWYGPNPTFLRWTRRLLYVAIAVDVTFALLFSYMRGEVFYPLLMFFLAILMRKALRAKHVLLLLLMLPVLAFIYQGIGELRSYGIYGTERIEQLTERIAPEDEDGDGDGDEGLGNSMLTLIARGCQFGQLSQVARIASEDGYYQGETLGYLIYAFIPRIIWPEKPLVTPGQWFAEKIGRGQRISDTHFSNSINMTLVGEFYLNFGWPGAMAGVLLMTFLFAAIWQTTGFYDLGNNPIGQTLGIMLLFQAMVSSSAAGILNLIFLYLAVFAIGRALGFLAKRRDHDLQENRGRNFVRVRGA